MMEEASDKAPGAPLPQVSRRRTAIVGLAFHYSGILIALAYAILLVPLYLRYISIPLYGAWLATGNIIAWLELVDPGLSTLLQQRIATLYGQQDTRRLSAAIGTGLVLSFGTAIVPLLALPFATLLPRGFDLAPEEADILVRSFQYALVALSLTIASYAPTACNVGLQRAFTTGSLNLAASVVGIVVMAGLLLLGVGLPSLPLGMMARAGLQFSANALSLFWWSRKHLERRPSWDRNEAKLVAGASMATFTARLGGALLLRVDALISSRLGSSTATAVLTMTGRALEPVRMAADRLGPALLPAVAHLAGERGNQGAAGVTLRVVRAGGWVTALGTACVVALNRPFVELWVGHELYGGRLLTFLLGVSVALSVLTGIMAQTVFALGGIRQSAYSGIIEGVIKVGLQIALFQVFGLTGLPVAAIAASLLVSAWYLPYLAGNLTGAPATLFGKPLFAAWSETILLSALGHGIGTLLDAIVPEWTWGTFVAASALVAAALTAVLWVIDARLRLEVGTALRARMRAPAAPEPKPTET